jgi:hypothetical protein
VKPRTRLAAAVLCTVAAASLLIAGISSAGTVHHHVHSAVPGKHTSTRHHHVHAAVTGTPTSTKQQHIRSAVTGKRMVGTSTPGLAVFPTADAVRAYWHTGPKTQLPSAPTGAAVFVSFKALPTPSAFAADLAAWAASGRQVYWTYYHEADGGGLTPAAFQTGWASLLAVEAAHPYPNLHSTTILMAYALIRGNAEAYYVPNVDVIGFDCYNLGTEGKAIAYAASKNKPLIFGEVGDALVGHPNSDALALAYAESFWAALTPNVIAAIWWSGPADTLVGKPQTAAFLAAQL